MAMRISSGLITTTWLLAAFPLTGQNPVVVTGVVTDRASGTAIEDATVQLDGRDVGHTDTRGRFRIGADLSPGTHRIAAARIGYNAGETRFTLDDETLTVDVAIQLESVPVELEPISVEGEEVELTTGRMTGFYRRRRNTPGHFFTREDIRRIGAQRFTEIVRRVPGTVIYSPENVHADPLDPNTRPQALEQRTIIEFSQRQGNPRGAPCEPLIFLNDVQIFDRNIDWYVPVESIAAVEAYTSSAQVPAEYNKFGASCGVVVVWTDGPTRRQSTPLVRTLEVGGLASFRVRNGFEGERFGIQMRVPLFGTFEFHPNFNLIVGNTAEGDAGWQILGAIKARPLGRNSPFYLGAGGTIIKNRISFFQSQRAGEDETEAFLLGLAGLSVPVGPIRPFVEFQLADPLGDRDGYLATGFTIRQR